ncbi:class I SAM-dependent methyltransferase [Mycolicibacterium agri]|uniref:Methyltransferase domain-containing protein n=1 Tax=Mycolicibacterium agri TaxID=36811 RepID=A0A7I9WCG8_MYCAG|nr:class I SAM-dependent methyltransferase [Mycolicibacterium agri]GFG55433.1 hypothetical protein MAGR_68740 [Mycolicibacterium agri]
MKKAAIRRSYTEIADVYILKFGSVADVDPEDLAFLKRNLGDCDGAVLDAGCGPGHLTAYLSNLGLSARGISTLCRASSTVRGHSGRESTFRSVRCAASMSPTTR